MTPLSPEMTAELEAIDATLAGEPVDPEHADLAELALLLRAERPEVSPEFVTLLDEGVARRFAAESRPRRPAGRWMFAPAAGLAVALVVAVVVAASSGGGLRGVKGGSAPPPTRTAQPALPAHAPVSGGLALSPAATAAPAPVPSPGRQQVQSSELSLATAPRHMEDVAHEVLLVVRRYNGYVNNSTVTAGGGPNGYSEFQLTVPSSNLGLALSDLSTLQYAQVVSRTDNTNDVTDQFNAANSQLSQAQALRTSLLKQLQNAVTQTQIDAIDAQLRDANAKIAGAQATLHSLNRQISYSQISLTVQTRPTPVPVGSGGFTLGKATRDAGKVLTVAAGVGLIALAALVPLGLVAALLWWGTTALRRRRREQALDLA